jgi:hypothetical protein
MKRRTNIEAAKSIQNGFREGVKDDSTGIQNNMHIPNLGLTSQEN